MCTIQYISDIHLEFIKEPIKIVLDKIIPKSNICVLAGDIGYPFQNNYTEFLISMNSKFKYTFLIHGNHEYYNRNKSMEEIIKKTKDIIKINKLNNIYFLNNSYVDIDNYRFIGSTLWTYIENPKYQINDSRCIMNFDYRDINNIHLCSVDIINDILYVSENKKVIMITHHLPSYKLIDEKYKTNNINSVNQCFASNTDDLIKKPIILWIFGHTHQPTEKIINGIKCVANPIGYPNELDKPYYNKIISL